MAISYSQAVANINKVKTTSAKEKAAAISGLSKYYPSGGSSSSSKSSGGSSKSSGGGGAVSYDPYTGKKLSAGGSFTDKLTGVTYKQGSQFNYVAPSDKQLKEKPLKEKPEMTERVDVGQPSPETVEATPFTGGLGIQDTLAQAGQPSDYASRSKLAASYGIQNYRGTADQNNLLKQKWQQAQQAASASGQPPPTGGTGAGALAPFTPQTPQEMTSSPEVDNFYSTDPMLASGMQEVLKWLSPPETTKALEQSMKAIVRDQREMANLKLELADVERIMDGTDQDIRDEVTKAGGFATDSQVAAMTVGRNKELLKRASIIQNQMTYMQDVINSNMTMYGFQKDMASQQFQQRSFLLNYKMQNDDRIYRANQDAVKNQLSLLGADGLYNSAKGDPVMVDRIERTLGLPGGSLATAASQAAAQRSLETRAAEASIANIYSQMAERGKTVGPVGAGMSYNTEGKPLTSGQSTALGYGTRLVQSSSVLNNLDEKFAKTPRAALTVFGKELVPNILKSKDRQQYEQAERNFVNAVLRRESGAAISPSEFENARSQYFAVYGDDPTTIAQKQQNRNLVIRNFLREGGQGEVDPTKVSLTPGGELVIIID